MIGELAPRSKAAEAFSTIAETLAGREPSPQPAKRSLFSFSGKLALRKK
jgi:Flp pilus assembly CpaE family ATPase